jgi:hypothetical protein
MKENFGQKGRILPRNKAKHIRHVLEESHVWNQITSLVLFAYQAFSLLSEGGPSETSYIL